MCRCDICKRRTRAAAVFHKTFLCQVCLGGLQDGQKVPVRGKDTGDQICRLSAERDLVFEDRIVVTPPIPVMPAPVPVAPIAPIAPPKRGPGRPKKNPVPEAVTA